MYLGLRETAFIRDTPQGTFQVRAPMSGPSLGVYRTLAEAQNTRNRYLNGETIHGYNINNNNNNNNNNN